MASRCALIAAFSSCRSFCWSFCWVWAKAICNMANTAKQETTSFFMHLLLYFWKNKGPGGDEATRPARPLATPGLESPNQVTSEITCKLGRVRLTQKRQRCNQ